MSSTYKGEKELVILLTKPNLSNNESERLEELLSCFLDWEKIIGMLEVHRVSGMAWKNIQKTFFKNDGNKCTYPRLYKFLHDSYFIQNNKANEQLDYTMKICNALNENNIDYVLLKGLVVSSGIYNDLGLRDFNDNDILVHPEDIKKVTNLILSLGYKQGSSNHLTKIKESTRREKVIRSFSSHEVMPFILNIPSDSKLSRQHIVDLHFSVKLMTNQRDLNLLEKWMNEKLTLEVNGVTVNTLSRENMLIFLCEHFYKEATSKRDLLMYKDLLLYKICDIYYLLTYQNINLNELIREVKRIGFDKQFYYSLKYVDEIFRIPEIMKQVRDGIYFTDTSFLDEVYYYNSTEVAYKYDEKCYVNRLFDITKPKEVQSTEKI